MAAVARVAAFLRKHSPVCAAVGLSAAIVVSALPQTFGLSRYKRLLQNHNRDGTETLISSDLQHLIDRVIRRMTVTPEEESRLEFFVSSPHNPIHKGSVQLRTGAIIGLPATLLYKSADELTAVELLIDSRVSQRVVNWSSDAGLALLDSLLLGEKAKAFIIARELHYITPYDVHVDVALRTLFGILAYTTGSVMNVSLQLSKRFKPWPRFMAFSLVGASWLLMYVQVNDALCCWRDNRADRKAASLTRAYAEGGVDYYESVLRRNKALRTLLGSSDGPRQFTLFGNELSTLRNPHVQLTARRDNLVKYLKDYDVVEEPQTDDSEQKV